MTNRRPASLRVLHQGHRTDSGDFAARQAKTSAVDAASHPQGFSHSLGPGHNQDPTRTKDRTVIHRRLIEYQRTCRGSVPAQGSTTRSAWNGLSSSRGTACPLPPLRHPWRPDLPSPPLPSQGGEGGGDLKLPDGICIDRASREIGFVVRSATSRLVVLMYGPGAANVPIRVSTGSPRMRSWWPVRWWKVLRDAE
jgi:hypothetical protein